MNGSEIISKKIKLIPKKNKTGLIANIIECWQLYIIILLPVLYIIIFSYIPMGGILIAFKDYKITKGIWGSAWAGFRYFEKFFNTPSSITVITNTLILSVYKLALSFPFPIILALALNEVRAKFFKKTVQMITYAPYFISTVVMVGLLAQFLDLRSGIINLFIGALGFEPVNFMAKAKMFRNVYVWSDIWQYTGYSAVIYIAALAGINVELYEAAMIDGASKVKRIWHIDIPGIMPTVVILLILSTGQIMNVGFEKVYLMQNNMNSTTSEIIATFVYKVGLQNMNYSFSTAVGLFNSVINLILLTSVNYISKRLGDTSLW